MNTEIDAKLVKAISEVNRIKILHRLYKEEICVCELAASLDMAYSLISFHLKELYGFGILDKKREGNKFFYFIKDEWRKRLSHYFTFLSIST